LIGILTLFGEMDLQPILKKPFSQMDIFFVQDNCNTSVQLMNQLDEHAKEADVVIIYANAVNMEAFPELVDTIRSAEKLMRIVLILNGRPEQYLRSVLNEYNERNIDLIFDDDGFDAEELLNYVKKGKLSHRDTKIKRKSSGFQGDIETDRENVRSAPGEPEKPRAEKRKQADKKAAEKMLPTSFSQPQGHFVVGIMNAAHGAGATTTAYNLARYFAMHGYKTCIADLSGTGAVKLMKAKNVDLYTEHIEINQLKDNYNITVCDFGTPVEISADGQNFKLAGVYTPQNIQGFIGSDIKLILGFSDPWNIEKIKFFFNNDTWREKFDNSYIFVLPKNTDKLKSLYPDYNILNREDDFREMILELFRREES
jgi:hypothetical protein